MPRICTYKNPLVRNGTGRHERMPPLLDPDSIRIDERTEADFLKYILDYSESLQHFNESNEPSGNWRAFFEKDVSVLIAMLSKTDTTADRQALETLPHLIRSSEDAGEVETAFRGLFELNFSMFIRMNRWFSQIPKELEMHAFMHRLITSGMKEPLRRLAALYKGAAQSPSLLGTGEPGSLLQAPFRTWEQFRSAGAGPVWYTTGEGPETPWADILDLIPTDTTSFGPDRGLHSVSSTGKIRYALPVLENVSERFFKSYNQCVLQSSGYLKDSLENYPAHEPHMGLLLAFLRLFNHALKDLNSLTRRHLDFYYRDVLRLKPTAPVMDRVFLIGEVAQHLDQARVEQGTLLKAGEDALENEVLYRVTRDSYLNQARITEIKTVFTGKTQEKGIYAAPVANSADGEGEEFDDPLQGWAPFGEPQSGDNRTMGDARLGFAVASPVLRMHEGERHIFLVFTADSQPETDRPFSDLFRARITTEEEWHPAAISEPSAEELSELDEPDAGFVLAVRLAPGDPPVVDFDPDLHEGRFDTGAPVLRVELLPDENGHIYHRWRNYRVDGCRIAVHVNGFRDLIIQSDLGRLDLSKPIQPFGPVPRVGARFLIGSPEIFAKRVTDMTLHLTWPGWPEAGLDNYYENYGEDVFDFSEIRVDRLLPDPESTDGWRHDEQDEAFPFFEEEFEQELKVISEPFDGEQPDLKEFRVYRPGMPRGFVGFELAGPDDPFWHSRYRQRLTQYAVQGKSGDPPVEPFTPQIGELSVDYKAEADIPMESPAGGEVTRHRFYHLYPFGIDPVQKTGRYVSVSPHLLPQFSSETETGTEIHDGELFIGLESWLPQQSLSMLFMVKVGSEDPELKEMPVRWYYRSGYRWKPLRAHQDYRDETLGLLKTGIITFQLPKDATTGDELFETDEPLHWIKAVVTGQARRFPKMIDIRAQAFPVEFTDRNNDPDYLSTPLQSGTISKFKQSRSDVRSIEQPWAAVKGRMPERGNEFYRRISERLRHRDRGVAIHDYERLVLQQFPDVWLAKCINHSTYEYAEPDDRLITAEFAPGYVTMLIVPDLTNQNLMDPLQPRVSFFLRREIRDHLKKKLPYFAAEKLSVINPRFEPVRVELTVHFLEVTDVAFYKKKLKEDIQAFLAPWAYGRTETFRFGGTVHKSMIVNYIDELSYVDYVTGVRMFHKAGDTFQEVNEATANTSRSVLTSDRNHKILNGSETA